MNFDGSGCRSAENPTQKHRIAIFDQCCFSAVDEFEYAALGFFEVFPFDLRSATNVIASPEFIREITLSDWDASQLGRLVFRIRAQRVIGDLTFQLDSLTIPNQVPESSMESLIFAGLFGMLASRARSPRLGCPSFGNPGKRARHRPPNGDRKLIPHPTSPISPPAGRQVARWSGRGGVSTTRQGWLKC